MARAPRALNGMSRRATARAVSRAGWTIARRRGTPYSSFSWNGIFASRWTPLALAGEYPRVDPDEEDNQDGADRVLPSMVDPHVVLATATRPALRSRVRWCAWTTAGIVHPASDPRAMVIHAARVQH